MIALASSRERRQPDAVYDIEERVVLTSAPRRRQYKKMTSAAKVN
jgi:hypothetical protein